VTREQVLKLTSSLRPPYFAGGGYLYDCPLCDSPQDFSALVLVNGDEYGMSYACFCKCDTEKAGEKLAELSGLPRPVWLPQPKPAKRARVARKKKAPDA
jgi:hypothetical protein